MPSASRAAGTRPARRTAVSAWASAESTSSASRKAATITRCWATPSAFSLDRVRSWWWMERSSSLPVTPSGMRGSGSRGPLGASREPAPALAVVAHGPDAVRAPEAPARGVRRPAAYRHEPAPPCAAGATAVVSARRSPTAGGPAGPAGRPAGASAAIAALLGHAINS